MDSFSFNLRFTLSALAGMLFLTVSAIIMAMVMGLHDASIEAGPLEASQELFLLAATGLFGWAAWRQKHAGRLAAFCAAVLCAVFFFRELELPVSGPLTAYLNSDAFRWHEAAVVALITLPYAFMRRHDIPEILSFICSRRVLPFIVAAVMLLAADRFDHMRTPFGISYLGTFIEETLEMLAYFLLATAAGQVWINARAEKDASIDVWDRDTRAARR